jgi:AcrR family transcriptional regulator
MLRTGCEPKGQETDHGNADVTQNQRKPRNGRQPLTPERIVDAAVTLMDKDGYSALSMRKLARSLHVEAMSLYDHFESKDALLRGMRSHFYRRLDEALPTSASWVTHFTRNMTELFRLGVEHPSFVAVQLQVSGAEESKHRGERDMEILQEAGFSETEAAAAISALVSYVIGFQHRMVLIEQQEGNWILELAQRDRDGSFRLGLTAMLDGLNQRLQSKSG